MDFDQTWYKKIPSLVKIHWRMLILEWPWKSIGFQIVLWTKYVPSLIKIHWMMLIPECSQRCYAVKIWPGDLDIWSMTLKGHRVIFFTAYNPCEHSRINILQWILIKLGTYLVLRRIWNPFDFQCHSRINILQWILIKLGIYLVLKIIWKWTKYVSSLVKIHWRMLILECSQRCYAAQIWPGDLDLWSMTLKINRVPDYLKD
jgi:hypothetical protein